MLGVKSILFILGQFKPNLGCIICIILGHLKDTISDLLKHKPSGWQFNLHIYFLVHSLFGQNKLHGGSEYPLFAAQFVSDILSSMFFRDHQFDQLTRKRGKQKRKKGDVSKPNEPARGIQPVRQFHERDETKILLIPTISLEMHVPSQGHYGFHSFPVVYWFCLFI